MFEFVAKFYLEEGGGGGWKHLLVEVRLRWCCFFFVLNVIKCKVSKIYELCLLNWEIGAVWLLINIKVDLLGGVFVWFATL